MNRLCLIALFVMTAGFANDEEYEMADSISSWEAVEESIGSHDQEGIVSVGKNLLDDLGEDSLIAENEQEGLDTVVTIPVESSKNLLISKNTASFDELKKELSSSPVEINLKQVFSSAPYIYGILLVLSIASITIWLYCMVTISGNVFLPHSLLKDLKSKLISNQFSEAMTLCEGEGHFICKILSSGILARKYGLNTMIETMKSEGKRTTVAFWQRLNLLNDIAIIAPMLGLLGTVTGMFYAFYDLNRSIESISMFFDGFGVSVGTTVAGLIVAILSMVLHSVAKYRLVKMLALVENEVHSFATLIDTRSPNYVNT